MVYKKYIKRNGKLYGPYIYHSKRVDGKVISEYHGPKKKFNYNFIWLILGGIFLIAMIYFLIFSDKGITGHAVLGIKANYDEGNHLTGNLNLKLKEGELIPASSKIVFENAGKTYEFDLKDVVEDETVKGDFYIEEKNLSGNGDGYGTSGSKENYPEIDFILNIYTEENNESGNSEGGSETPSTEETPEEITEPENETQNEISNNNPEQEITETEEINEEPAEVNTEETPSEEQPTTKESFEVNTEETSTGETPEETPITGNVVGGILNSVSNFFLRLTITGHASLELTNEISGKVSKNNEFIYNLEEGQNAEIKPLSVKVNEQNINDNEIKLTIIGREVHITTEYSHKEEGFGKEYLGKTEKTIPINLEKLNLTLSPEELKIKIINENEEIISIKTDLKPGEINEKTPEEITEPEIPQSNITIEMNITTNEKIESNITIIEPELELTIQEKAALLTNFGNSSIKTTKSELKNNRIIIGYELGNYKIEYTYDSSLNNETLLIQMEQDRTRWLKDIAKMLISSSDPKNPSEPLDEYIRDYNY